MIDDKLEKMIEKLAVEKAQVSSAVGFHQTQMNQGLTKMAQIDGKMELLREMIAVGKKEKKKGKKPDDKKPDK